MNWKSNGIPLGMHHALSQKTKQQSEIQITAKTGVSKLHAHYINGSA